jgi:hypothetical protein
MIRKPYAILDRILVWERQEITAVEIYSGGGTQ